MTVYDASARAEGRQTTLPGVRMSELAVLYGNDFWPGNVPRVELDEERVRTLIRVLSRCVGVIIIDIEEAAWQDVSDPAADARWAKLVGWCKDEAPHAKLGIYNLPYGDYRRNVERNNDWHAGWLKLNERLAASPWFARVDFLCPDFYHQDEDATLELFQRRVDLNFVELRKAFPKRSFLSFVQRQTDYFAESVAYLRRFGSVAVWEHPE